jgi:hypothetical protein
MIAIVAGAALAAGCAQARSEAGPVTSRSYPVGQFDRIEVSGPYEVTVATGSAPSVRATGNENMLERLVVEIENGALKIHPRKTKGLGMMWSNNGSVKVAVTAPALSAAGIAGSGGVTIDRISGPSFDGSVAGSGDLKVARLDVQNLKMSIGGSGEIEAAGRASNASYEISGSGDIRAAQVAAEHAKVSIAGSGSVAGHATATAKVDIAGSGDVKMTGGAQCQVSKVGSGDVDCS